MKFLKQIGFLAVVLAAAALNAQNLDTFKSQFGGNKMRLDGTSTAHDWTVESTVIGGVMELDSALVSDPTKAKPGKVNAKVEVRVPARSLKSGKSPMDNVMHGALKTQQYTNIEYRLSELTLKETPKSADAPMQFDSKGKLTVAGVTNDVAFPVTIARTDGNKLKVTGSTSVKMTSFGITPPAPKIALGFLKTGDDVKISFEWVTAKAAATAAK